MSRLAGRGYSPPRTQTGDRSQSWRSAWLIKSPVSQLGPGSSGQGEVKQLSPPVRLEALKKFPPAYKMRVLYMGIKQMSINIRSVLM